MERRNGRSSDLPLKRTPDHLSLIARQVGLDFPLSPGSSKFVEAASNLSFVVTTHMGNTARPFTVPDGSHTTYMYILINRHGAQLPLQPSYSAFSVFLSHGTIIWGGFYSFTKGLHDPSDITEYPWLPPGHFCESAAWEVSSSFACTAVLGAQVHEDLCALPAYCSAFWCTWALANFPDGNASC